MVNARSFLVPFRYSHKVAYVVEFSHHKIRLYAKGNIVKSDEIQPVCPVDFSKIKTMGVGQVAIGGIVGDLDIDNPQRRPLEIQSPYSYEDLWDDDELCFKIQTIQNCDILYIFHENYPIHMLKRYANDDWRLEELELVNGPFMGLNTSEVAINSSGVVGEVELNASGHIFKESDEGRLMRFYAIEENAKSWASSMAITRDDVVYSDKKYYVAVNTGTTGTEKPTHSDGVRTDGGVQWKFLHDGMGIVKISDYVSETKVVAEVIKRLPNGVCGGVTSWEFGLLHKAGKYPISGAFFRNRFAFLVNTLNGPNVCLSVSGDYNNFADSDGGISTAETAITVPVLNKEFNEGKWLVAGDVLFVGTGAAEFYIDAISATSAMAADNVKILQISSVGSKAIMPVTIGAHIFFADRYGLTLRDLIYNYYNDGYDQIDMSLLGKHLFVSRIVALSYQETPDKILWCLMGDGTLTALTFSQEQEVAALSRHDFSGEVESIAVIPNLEDCRDELWIEVKRIIERKTVRSVEWVDNGIPQNFPLNVTEKTERAEKEKNIADYALLTAFYLDGAVLFERTLDDVREYVAGLNHLEGETVLIFADGVVLEPQRVINGRVDIKKTYNRVVVGLPIKSQFIPQNVYVQTESSTGVGQTQRINHVLFKFYLSGGGKVGENEDTLIPIFYRKTDAVMGCPQPLFTGHKEVLFNGASSVNGEPAEILIENDSPLPMNVLAIVPAMDVA